MKFNVGDVVKLKKCEYIEEDFWGTHVVIEDIIDSDRRAIVRYRKEYSLEHGKSFKCDINCLEKIKIPKLKDNSSN